jgi:tRNA pseudouridine55 synthase
MSAPRRPPRRRVDGVLLVDKPAGLTSNAALLRVRRLYDAEKAGHTGTLDPLASGLLPICFGAATRFAQFLLDARKRYVATVRFGVTTTTLDAEGDVVLTRPVALDREALAAALARFLGPQMQTPPAHAALKFEGRPYYEYARRGIEIPRAPREVTIHALQLLEWSPPEATLDVECSKGTYVRTLAADLGEALGCGAHLAALRRTASGAFDVDDAATLDALEAMSDEARIALLRPVSILVAELPRVELAPAEVAGFLQGRAVVVPGGGAGTKAGDARVCAVFGPGGLLGVANVDEGLARPRRVMPSGSPSIPGSAAAA